MATSKHARPIERAATHQSDTPSLFIPVATMRKCTQINNSNSPYVSDVISLITHERNDVISYAVSPTLINDYISGYVIM